MRRYILNSANFTYESFADNIGLVNLHSVVFDEFKKNSSFRPEYALKTLGWSNDRLGEVERIYYDGLLPLLDINEYELFDTMARIFPGDIISYYCDCIIHMKDKIREKVIGR